MKRAFFSVHSGIAARSMVSLARLIEQSQTLRMTFIIRCNPKESHHVLIAFDQFEADDLFIEFLHGIQVAYAEHNFAKSFDWSDRKSTRLNSSHQLISYAVFCL